MDRNPCIIPLLDSQPYLANLGSLTISDIPLIGIVLLLLFSNASCCIGFGDSSSR